MDPESKRAGMLQPFSPEVYSRLVNVHNRQKRFEKDLGGVKSHNVTRLDSHGHNFSSNVSNPQDTGEHISVSDNNDSIRNMKMGQQNSMISGKQVKSVQPKGRLNIK